MAMKPSSKFGKMDAKPSDSMKPSPAPSRKPFVPALKNGVRPPAPTAEEKKAQYDYQMKSDARKAALLKGIKRK